MKRTRKTSTDDYKIDQNDLQHPVDPVPSIIVVTGTASTRTESSTPCPQETLGVFEGVFTTDLLCTRFTHHHEDPRMIPSSFRGFHAKRD
ncbi:hypothetical protein WN55_06139 [Dufourea novaeangliae]|uniref:Uncharacterized protein n=1 Tax=Dufourea novaeangliae TaxID=178035 RepID=A0A154P3P4_DUFNO|nr:hypothetical protein WN55_06139 [Dufourea novaeangliae]